jgi:hypothetical protein
MLIKCRIMGVSNKGLFSREIGCLVAYVVGYAFGFIGLLAIFIVMSVLAIVSVYCCFKIQDTKVTRRLLFHKKHIAGNN